MNSQEWLEYAKQNKEVLKSLLAGYHPRSNCQKPHSEHITAAMAEMACEKIRQKIAAEPGRLPPVEGFEAALNAGDINTLMNLLNDAWFGVPESTACWGITGFRQAVDLMEDPPDDIFPCPECGDAALIQYTGEDPNHKGEFLCPDCNIWFKPENVK